jgi:S1-C subfamily serine protease
MRRRSSRKLLAVVAIGAALLGGLAALGIGKAAGWLDGDETVVVQRVEGGDGDATATPASARPLTGDRFDPAAIYELRSPGVVTIHALFGGGDESAAESQGSGFVADPAGYILTNSHVITSAGQGEPGAAVVAASEVYVEFQDGNRVPARIVGWDLFSDVGLLKVDPGEHALEVVPLGNSSKVVVGEPVAAIGSPFGQASSLAVGVVSATERSVSSLTSSYNVVDAIQTDAPINRGNSGGPLFNAAGEVIGINAQIRSDSGNAEGVGFAIPINTAGRSMEQLIATGRVRYAWVGISSQTLTPSLAEELDYPVEAGAAIQSVIPGGPAEAAGLLGGSDTIVLDGLQFERGGDVVVAINGTPVRTSEELGRIVAGELFPGETAQFTVIRDGERLTVPIELADRPGDSDLGP